jgi:hypothetical protein
MEAVYFSLPWPVRFCCRKDVRDMKIVKAALQESGGGIL